MIVFQKLIQVFLDFLIKIFSWLFALVVDFLDLIRIYLIVRLILLKF